MGPTKGDADIMDVKGKKMGTLMNSFRRWKRIKGGGAGQRDAREGHAAADIQKKSKEWRFGGNGAIVQKIRGLAQEANQTRPRRRGHLGDQGIAKKNLKKL